MQAPKRALGLALPSKGRWFDLVLTMAATSLRAPTGFECRFYVCANYADWQVSLLRILFSRRARFIDEKTVAKAGMTGAYNHAFRLAASDGCEWVALWADDLLPERRRWLLELFQALLTPGFQFGIFSSDEGGHKGHFGWNVFAGYPCAHFYVARVDALPGHMLNPRIRAYVGDNEICVSAIKRGTAIDLLPVRVIHQPTTNATRTGNTPSYQIDLSTVYELHPELTGRLDAIVLRGDVRSEECRFIADEGKPVRFGRDKVPMLSIEEFLARTPPCQTSCLVGLIGATRKLWNEFIVILATRVIAAVRG